MNRIKQQLNRSNPIIWFCLITGQAFVLILLHSLTAQAQWTNGTNINNTNSGNVGVGTTAPAEKLSVVGSLRLDGQSQGDNRLILQLSGGNQFEWYPQSTGLYLYDRTAIQYRLSVLNNGNFGIGTMTTPTSRLHVTDNTNNTYTARFIHSNATASNGVYIETQTAGAGDAALHITSNSGSNQLLMVRNNGNVGISATSPLQRLQIGSNTVTGTATPDAISLGATYSTVARANPKLRLFDNNSGSVYGLGISDSQMDFMVPTGARYVWSVNGTEKMRLDASGNITVTGNIAAKYQDVAEWVPSAHAISAGTVVIVDPAKSNHVMSSSQAYDTRVAGVISAQPGLTLGEGGQGKVLVATTGRVRIKVDATRTPIQIGDLLVTSDIKGLAMKSKPLKVGGRLMHMPGTLIGKALEPLAKGTGEILVLLSLQ